MIISDVSCGVKKDAATLNHDKVELKHPFSRLTSPHEVITLHLALSSTFHKLTTTLETSDMRLSFSFLTEAIGKLDSVFGTVRYQDVIAQNLLTEGNSVSC